MSAQTHPSADFFISYAPSDQAWAEWIAWELEAAGYSTFLQSWESQSVNEFTDAVNNALNTAEMILMILSPAYLESFNFIQQGWLLKALDELDRRLVVVRVEAADLPSILHARVYLDLAGLDEENARQALLSGIRRNRSKPKVAPRFPRASHLAAAELPRFPSALPPVWNVPYLRKPTFVGREGTLAELAHSVEGGRLAVISQTVLSLGGVGKTQVAVEYAYRYRFRYDVVWWIRADDPVTLIADYAALAFPLALPESTHPDQTLVLAAVRRWLQRHDRWLLIFDDAGPPNQVAIEGTQFATLRDFFPRVPLGHILITSRDTVWQSEAEVVLIDVLSPSEAVELLLQSSDEVDKGSAEELAQVLGYLPLALQQASSYIHETGTPLHTYLERIRAAIRDRRESAPTDPVQTFKTALEIVLQHLRSESPTAAELLEVAAFLADEDVPRDVFLQEVPQLTKSLRRVATDPIELDSSMALLARYSLIDTSEDAFTVHPLIQTTVRDDLDSQAAQSRVSIALGLVERIFPERADDVNAWPICERLVPHALAVTQYSHQLQGELSLTSSLLERVGIYFRTRGRLIEAKAVFEKALAIDERLYGGQHFSVAAGLNNLGLVLQSLGDLVAARTTFERALTIAESVYGPNHPEVARLLNNLGGVLSNLGELDLARAAFERALAIDEAALGPDHPSVSIRLNNLGRVLSNLGDLAAARTVFERALTIAESAYGPNHPQVARRLDNLGRVLSDLEDLEAARTVFERALAIDESAYGPDHPSVSLRLNNLGSVLYALGDLSKAEVVLERALRIDESIYGPNHPEVATDLSNLGRVEQELGDLNEAKSAFERALAINEAVYGPTHGQVATDLSNLGRVLQELGELRQARDAFERALSIYRADLGVEDPRTKRASVELAAVPYVEHDERGG